MKNTSLFFAFVMAMLWLIASPSLAQWTQTNGPFGGTVMCFASNGTNLFAGAREEILLSTDNGIRWRAVGTGLTNATVTALVTSSGNIFAGTSGGGVFVSKDSGTNWTAVNNGLTNVHVKAVAISPDGTTLFAGTKGGIFRSTDNGANWSAANSGLPRNPYGGQYAETSCLTFSGECLIAGTNQGVFRSTDSIIV